MPVNCEKLRMFAENFGVCLKEKFIFDKLFFSAGKFVKMAIAPKISADV